MEDGYGLDSVHDLNQRYTTSLKYPLDSKKTLTILTKVWCLFLSFQIPFQTED